MFWTGLREREAKRTYVLYACAPIDRSGSVGLQGHEPNEPYPRAAEDDADGPLTQDAAPSPKPHHSLGLCPQVIGPRIFLLRCGSRCRCSD